MVAKSRPVRAEINLDNIRYQIHSIRRQVGSETDIMAVVKADGYGHGSVPVAKAALEAGAERLAVALPEEGMELRAAGISAPIQVLGETLQEQFRLFPKYDLIPTICREDSRKKLDELAQEHDKKLPVVIKIDTGMGRIGIEPDDLPAYLQKVEEASALQIDSVMTHFATADEADKAYTHEQFDKFSRAVKQVEKAGIKKREDLECQVANSATVIDLPEYALDIVRPGIMMYGLPPSRQVNQSFDLKPVMTLKARIVFLKTVPPGTAISYGGTYVTEDKERIATLPLGYADGYPRLLSNKAEVLVNGQRAPIRGRVCMDQIMVDVSGISNVEVGDEVTLIGRDNNEEITAGEMAEMIGTINYEIVSRLGKRVPRVYHDE